MNRFKCIYKMVQKGISYQYTNPLLNDHIIRLISNEAEIKQVDSSKCYSKFQAVKLLVNDDCIAEMLRTRNVYS